MSGLLIRRLYCDGPLCTDLEPEEIAGRAGRGEPFNEELDGIDTTLAEIRADARAEGWHTDQPGGKDFCPECWKETHFSSPPERLSYGL